VSELLSAISTPNVQVISPLTLALLEDSGWYRADFSLSELSPFGHGVGCQFVFEDCIQDGEVPDWGRDFFCNDQLQESIDEGLSCSYNNLHITRCDLVDFLDYPASTPPDSKHQYFPNNPVSSMN
jgi:hypothetical protein